MKESCLQNYIPLLKFEKTFFFHFKNVFEPKTVYPMIDLGFQMRRFLIWQNNDHVICMILFTNTRISIHLCFILVYINLTLVKIALHVTRSGCTTKDFLLQRSPSRLGESNTRSLIRFNAYCMLKLERRNEYANF